MSLPPSPKRRKDSCSFSSGKSNDENPKDQSHESSRYFISAGLFFKKNEQKTDAEAEGNTRYFDAKIFLEVGLFEKDNLNVIKEELVSPFEKTSIRKNENIFEPAKAKTECKAYYQMENTTHDPEVMKESNYIREDLVYEKINPPWYIREDGEAEGRFCEANLFSVSVSDKINISASTALESDGSTPDYHFELKEEEGEINELIAEGYHDENFPEGSIPEDLLELDQEEPFNEIFLSWEDMETEMNEPFPDGDNDDFFKFAKEADPAVPKEPAIDAPASDSKAREASPQKEASSKGEESAVPELAVPESAVPESAVPELAAPESAVPESAVPESAVPESAVPESAAPESAVPELAAPEDVSNVVPKDSDNASK